MLMSRLQFWLSYRVIRTTCSGQHTSNM